MFRVLIPVLFVLVAGHDLFAAQLAPIPAAASTGAVAAATPTRVEITGHNYMPGRRDPRRV